MRIPYQPASNIPSWALEATFYHLYPLGFLGAPPRSASADADPTPRLQTLLDYLDHIVELGITAVYFGPVFASGSHGYDTNDYFHIDRRLGDNTLFQSIVDAFHARGLRIILDGVFNHTGRGFFAFQHILENGKDSPYHNWYRINWGADSAFNDGFAYESWEGHQSLPALNLEIPEVRNYLFEVARMWLADVGVDGWRLDVAYELPTEFLWEFRRVCKQANPESFLLGETISGDYRTFAAPDLLDAAYNYQFYESLHRSINDQNFHDLRAIMERAWHTEWGLYNQIGLVNFIGNHDVTRINSLLSEPVNIYPALIILLTAPGIPMLYYGDEVGLSGHKSDGDAALRKPMPAPIAAADAPYIRAAFDLYDTTQRLTYIRNTNPVFVQGRFAVLHAAKTTFAYLRSHTRRIAVTAVNTAARPAAITLDVGSEGIPDGTRFTDALDPSYSVTVTDGALPLDPIHPHWGRILLTG